MAISLEELQKLINPIVESFGCCLWGVELTHKKNGFFIRVYIENNERGIFIEDCSKVTSQLRNFFEAEEIDLGDYTLEVSSPGLDRPLFNLDHYNQMLGESVVVNLFSPFDGSKKFKGIIKGTEGFDVVIIVDEEELVIPLSCIKKARIIPHFDIG